MRVNIYRTELVKEQGINYKADTIKTNEDVVNMLCELFHMNTLPEEHCYLVCLSAKAKVVGVFLLSKGDLTSSIVHPRSVYQRAILANSYGVILAHNHPSGDSRPSRDDIDTSIRLQEAGELLGIHFMDSIIIGDEESTSLRAQGII